MLGLIALLVRHGGTLQATEELRDLPATTRAVLLVDADALRHTAAAKALVDAFVGEARITEVESVCGLDPMRSLAEATVWIAGPEDQPFESTGLLLRGRTADAESLANCHRLLVEGRGRSTVTLEAPGGPVVASDDRKSAIAALDERTVVTGSVKSVAEALAVRRTGAPSLAERARVAALWPKLRRKASIAAVFDPPSRWRSALERITTLGDDASALQGVETIGLSVKVGSTQAVEVYVDVADRARAEQNAALLRAWAESPPEAIEPPWAEVVRTMRVALDDNTVVLTLDVTALSTNR